MKLLFLILTATGVSSATAASLEGLMMDQFVQKIEPVTVKGKGFISGEGRAGLICASLGFTRLETFEDEFCDAGEELLVAQDTSPAAGSIGVVKYADFGPCSQGMRKFTSVTCVK